MPLVNVAGTRAKRYATITGGGGGGAGNVGQLGPYAALNLSSFPIYSIDMSLADYHLFATQGNPAVVGTTIGLAGSGTSTHNAGAWPLGGNGYCRITPPTTNQYERGIYLGNLWRNATLQIRDFNLRWEWRASPNWCSNGSTGSKYTIIHSSRTFATPASTDDRPVMFFSPMTTSDTPAFNRANTWVTCPSQETTPGWGEAIYDDTDTFNGGTLTYYPNSVMQYYHTNDGDTGTFQSRPKVEAGEVITFEMRCQSINAGAYPRGLIAFRMYRENGFIAERGIPWNYDQNVPLGAYIFEVQQFGCGQWNVAPNANAQWFDIGGVITVARNFNGWLGRRNA